MPPATTRKGAVVDINICKSLLPDFVRWLSVERDVSATTSKHHIYQLQIMLDNVSILDEEAARSFIYEAKDTYKSRTIERYIYTLRVFCDYLIYRRHIETNWARNIPFPKHSKLVPVILTNAEIEAIIGQDLPSSYQNYKDSDLARRMFDSIFNILARTGARVGELLNMKVEDVNWIEKTWILNDTKTRTGRIVPLPDDVIITLKELARDRAPDDLIFTNPRSGKKVNATVICRNFKQRLIASGVKKRATIHTLRHSFIVEMFKQDVSPLKIANIVGHENIKTTQDYARLLVEDLRDAMMRHPLTAKNRNPYDIMTHIKDTIEHFRLKEDGRFFYELTEGNEGLRMTIFVR